MQDAPGLDDEVVRVLGVRPEDVRGAPEAVRAAFRRLAMKFHPARNVGDPAAEARFQEISRVYGAWADRHAPANAKPAATDEATLQNIMAQVEGVFATFPHARGEDVQVKMELSPGDVTVGCARDVLVTRNVLRAGELAAREETVRVSVPAGMKDGYVLRMAGEGHEAQGDGDAGDLYIAMVLVDANAAQRGAALEIEAVVPASRVFFGGRLTVSTPDGPAEVRVPWGVRDGARRVLAGRGLVGTPSDESRGDPYREAARGDAVVVFRVAAGWARWRLAALVATAAAIATAVVAALR